MPVSYIISNTPIIRSNPGITKNNMWNPNDLILLNYHASTSIKQPKTADPLIATYQLNYQKGKVIALGISSDDIIANSKFNKFFDSLLLKYSQKSPTFSIHSIS
jgi:hypothetical protein